MSSSGSGSSPSIEIFEIRVTSQSVLKSVELSIGSVKRESFCLPGAKTHKFELPSPRQLLPSEPLCLRVRFRDLFRVMAKNKIHLDEILSNVDPQSSGKQEWSKSFDKFDVVLKVKSSQNAGNASNEPESSTSGESGDLPPTTDALFKLVERFRVLVIGNSGVGKSSLINECFGVKDASVAHAEAGKSNINTEIKAKENGRFVLHDSQGFEHGEGDNFKKVVDFLKARKDMPNVRDQVHAVWLCFQVSVSEGDRLFEAGVEELFRMKSRGELGPVPVITVFTKYDRLVTQVKFGNNNEFMRRTKTLDADARNALLVKEANERFETLCVRPFRAVVGPDVPHISVSTKKEYINTLKDLTALTAKYVKECLAVDVAEEVAVLSAVAQRVNPAMKIDAVIAVGKKRYWRGLASSANFPGKTIDACLRVLHTDIVRVWNMQDEFGHLESKEFRALMTTLAGEQYDELSDPNTTIIRASPLFGVLTGLVGGLSGPAAPIVIPIAAVVVLAKWGYDVYKQSELIVQRLMAYIVDFTIIMQIIFGLVVNAQLHLTRRLIKLAFATYNSSLERRQVHNEIRDHVKLAGRVDRDAALAEMLRLIKNYQLNPEDMDKLQFTMGEGFDNVEDEPWDVPKA